MTGHPVGDGREDSETPMPPPLPENLAILVGALQGPPDMGRNHNRYLSYPDRERADGATSA